MRSWHALGCSEERPRADLLLEGESLYIINIHENSIGGRKEKDMWRRWERKVNTKERKQRKKERRLKKEEKRSQ